MQCIKIESDRITLPPEVFGYLKGKEIRFLRYEDGFVMKPVSESVRENSKVSKLAKLKQRKLINGDPDDLVNVKVGEWNEPDNM